MLDSFMHSNMESIEGHLFDDLHAEVTVVIHLSFLCQSLSQADWQLCARPDSEHEEPNVAASSDRRECWIRWIQG